MKRNTCTRGVMATMGGSAGIYPIVTGAANIGYGIGAAGMVGGLVTSELCFRCKEHKLKSEEERRLAHHQQELQRIARESYGVSAPRQHVMTEHYNPIAYRAFYQPGRR